MEDSRRTFQYGFILQVILSHLNVSSFLIVNFFHTSLSINRRTPVWRIQLTISPIELGTETDLHYVAGVYGRIRRFVTKNKSNSNGASSSLMHTVCQMSQISNVIKTIFRNG